MTTNYLSLPKDSDLLEFNCLGTIFVIRQASLQRFPNTLLGDPKRRATFFHKTRGQFIIDRHIVSFEAILYYYETGKLIAPTIYEPTIFLEELKYFQIDSETIDRFYENEIHDEFPPERRFVPSNKISRWIYIALEFDDVHPVRELLLLLKTKLFSVVQIRFVCLIVSLIFCLNISIELIPQISRETLICHRSSTDCDELFFDFRPSKSRAEWILRIEQSKTGEQRARWSLVSLYGFHHVGISSSSVGFAGEMVDFDVVDQSDRSADSVRQLDLLDHRRDESLPRRGIRSVFLSEIFPILSVDSSVSISSSLPLRQIVTNFVSRRRTRAESNLFHRLFDSLLRFDLWRVNRNSREECRSIVRHASRRSFQHRYDLHDHRRRCQTRSSVGQRQSSLFDSRRHRSNRHFVTFAVDLPNISTDRSWGEFSWESAIRADRSSNVIREENLNLFFVCRWLIIEVDRKRILLFSRLSRRSCVVSHVYS